MTDLAPALDHPRVDVLGTRVSAITMADATRTIERWIADRDQHYVCVTTVHGVMEGYDDPSFQAILNGSGMTTPDGMPLVWLGKRAGHDVTRVYGPDLLLEMSALAAERGYRFFLYGGNEGVADELARRLEARYPRLQVVGTHCPPFRPLTPEEDEAVVDEINASGADIVWVGLSTPKQERWMVDHLGRIEAPVLIGVGAAFDFHSGQKKQAPRWMQRNGLEWLFRLLQEPRRLWKRYLVLNTRFLLLTLKLRRRRDF